jgi:hypothetical protein
MARSSTTKQSGTQAPVRATSEKSEPVTCRVERESGKDVKSGGKSGELYTQLGKRDEK